MTERKKPGMMLSNWLAELQCPLQTRCSAMADAFISDIVSAMGRVSTPCRCLTHQDQLGLFGGRMYLDPSFNLELLHTNAAWQCTIRVCKVVLLTNV
jgi:hypothetical protein